jgi:hypothetical protein
MTQEPATVRSAVPSVPMTAEQRAAFERDGYLIIRGALYPDEVAGAHDAIDRVYAAMAKAGSLGPDGSMHLLSAVAVAGRLGLAVRGEPVACPGLPGAGGCGRGGGALASSRVLRWTVGAAGRRSAGDASPAGDVTADEFAAVATAGPCPDMAVIQT